MAVTSLAGLLEGVIQATARGGEIACAQIERQAAKGQAAKDAVVAEFYGHTLGFVKPRCGPGVIALKQRKIGLMGDSKRQPGRVVERALDAFAFSQIAGGLGRW